MRTCGEDGPGRFRIRAGRSKRAVLERKGEGKKMGSAKTWRRLIGLGAATVAVGASSAAWACTLGVGPGDGLYQMALNPPTGSWNASGQKTGVGATAVFDGSPGWSTPTALYQDAGQGSGTLGSDVRNTVAVSGPLPDQCSQADTQIGNMTWTNNVGTATGLTLQARRNDANTAYVPGVYEVCTFISTNNRLNRFIGYFTFV